MNAFGNFGLKPASVMLFWALMVQACQAAPIAPQAVIPSPTETAFTVTPSPTITVPAPTLPVIASSTPALPTVKVIAVGGNIFIRRGPDLAYNAVSVLMDGQGSKAVARDVLGGWVQIFRPEAPRETGWVSIQTAYTQVRGEVMSLPEAMPTDWPLQAWLRNCTHHLMLVSPGDILIPPVNEFPDNEVLLNPGVYLVYDTEVDRMPEVMELEIKEGSELDVLDDGNEDHRQCPQ